jgi:hypothetical protein
MAAPLFGKHWYEKPKDKHGEAMEQFKAAVVSARGSSDDAIKQVIFKNI